MLVLGTTLGAQVPAGGVELLATSTACPAPSRSDSGAAPTRDTTAARTGRPASAEVGARGAAIVLVASASAREVRFGAQPKIVVRLCGALADSVHVVERRNLPERIQPGTTYRDVFIAVEILGHLNADCLARRIGVAPRDSTATDDCASLGIRDSSGARPPGPRRSPP
jgi:hypothetical protein